MSEIENMNWIALAIPKDCHYIFVCASEDIFDARVKHGMMKLYDNRNEQCETSLPCFIGYAPAADLKALDTLAGIPTARKDEDKCCLEENCMEDKKIEILYQLLERAEGEKEPETAAALRWAIFQLEAMAN